MARKELLFIAIFAFIGFITLQIPFTKLAGSNVSFTLFDFFGPIAGAFLGPWLGVMSVLIVELVNVVVRQTPLTTGSVIRLFPMLFAVWYFGVMSSRQARTIDSKLILAVPILAIIIFIAHPIGRTVWYYSLFWVIPIIAYLKRDVLLVRSLGATFTAHAVGGAAWIWAFSLKASVWQSLIPIVIQERLLFTLGICASYLAIKHSLSFLSKKKLLPDIKTINPSFSA